MINAYDDRDGHIWMDGELVPWRNANVHILTHALHYGSSIFEGERSYNGKIFKSREHSQRLIESGNLIDVPVPYNVDEIEIYRRLWLEGKLFNEYPTDGIVLKINSKKLIPLRRKAVTTKEISLFIKKLKKFG